MVKDKSAFAERRIYGIRHGSEEQEQHRLALHHGLALLPRDFACSICWWCHGTGVPKKNEGFACDICNGTGLLQGSGEGEPSVPAFDSQRHQVLEAACLSLLLPFEVKVC